MEQLTKNTGFECLSCGEMNAPAPLEVLGSRIRISCEECVEKHDRELEQKELKRLSSERDSLWRRVCPPVYLDTNPQDSRLDPKALHAASSWTPRSNSGIGLVGKTGIGKTRMLFLALRKALDAGQTIYAVSHPKFASAASDAPGARDERDRANARQILKESRDAGVLLLDDIGKGHFTERATQELYDLIEFRTSHRRPILWSAQGGAVWMREKLGPDRGPAIVRRLAEFSTLPELPRDHR